MKYPEALQILKRPTPYKIYTITGEETYLANNFLTKLLAKLNPQKDPEAVQKFDANTELSQIFQALDSSPFFSEKNIIIIDEPKFLKENFAKSKKEEQELFSYLEDIPDYSILILKTLGKLDKRKKLSKILEKVGMVVECETLTPWTVEPWLKNRLQELNLRFTSEAFTYFLEIIKAMETISLDFINQELTKLTLLSGNKTIDLPMLKENLASIPEVSAFRLWEALCNKRIAAALNLYNIQIQSGIHPLQILGLIVRQMRQLWQIKVLMEKGRVTPNIIAKEVKLHPFIAEKIMAQAKGFSLKRIEDTISKLCDADYLLKTGNATPTLMEQIFIEFTKK